MTTVPQRRWLRFSLRTLFIVVTVVAVLLGYELNWIVDRHHALDWIARQAEYWRDVPVDQRVHIATRAPWSLRLFGEEGVQAMCVVVALDTVAAKQYELERLFPEATVLVVTPGPGYSGKHAGE